MIYQAKPQRGGRSIPFNTSNPPQDPPPPAVEIIATEMSQPGVIVPVEEPVIDVVEIPEIIKPIKIQHVKPQTTPTIPDTKPYTKPDTVVPTTIPVKKKKVAIPVVKITLRLRIVSFFKKLVRRN